MSTLEEAASRKYWFPAKRYGWGWGLPCAWQGWAVLLIFLALLGAGGLLLRTEAPMLFLAYTAVLTAALLVICWLKGEPPCR
jgi:hypothetical protein